MRDLTLGVPKGPLVSRDVFWCLQWGREDDTGAHLGWDLSLLSQVRLVAHQSNDDFVMQELLLQLPQPQLRPAKCFLGRDSDTMAPGAFCPTSDVSRGSILVPRGSASPLTLLVMS